MGLRPILNLAVAALALVTAAALAARLWWAFDLLSHFRLQYLAAAVALGALALALHAYPAALACALVALVHGWAVKDLWLGAAPVPPGGVPLRVATANVLNGNPTPEKVLDFVRGSGADLVVLVDARGERWRPVLAAVGDLYPYRVPDDWREGGQVLLFSREPVLADTVVQPGAAPRPYLVAKLATVTGAPLVVAVHPTSPSPTEAVETRERNFELGRIADAVGGVAGPVVVAGDFNTSPWSPRFRDLLAATGLRDAARGQGWVGTWPAWFRPALVPIDHVLVGGPVAVADLRRGPFVGSDHYPLVADLRLYGGSAVQGSATP
jgi:endonuclease/exonuclease/phosphatase (EEP) superfamily protein YafD